MVCLISCPDQAKNKILVFFVYPVKFMVMRSEADFTGVSLFTPLNSKGQRSVFNRGGSYLILFHSFRDSDRRLLISDFRFPVFLSHQPQHEAKTRCLKERK